MKILYIDPTRLFWVYTIILISNIGNLHVYSDPTVIWNTRVRIKNCILCLGASTYYVYTWEWGCQMVTFADMTNNGKLHCSSTQLNGLKKITGNL